VSLIAASGVGVGLAILLFLRAESRDMVVRRKSYGNERFSRQMRTPEQMEVLTKRGGCTAIFELQGSLFFGTTDQLYSQVEPELKKRRFLILDMRRVESIDFTAAHMLELVEDVMADRDGLVIFSHMPSKAPSGQDMAGYFKQVGLVRHERHVRIFPHLDAALEWVEDRLLEEVHLEQPVDKPFDIRELHVIKERKPETIAALEASIEMQSFKAGETIFKTGDAGNEICLIRRGSVRILMRLAGRVPHHLATYGPGAMFGEIAFLDGEKRSADAVAFTDVELYVLTRAKFDDLVTQHHKLALNLMEWIANTVAARLREADQQLQYLKES